VAEPDFLDELSRLIGEHDVTVRATTTTGSAWERSVNQSPRRQRILDVADLGAVPRGRMVILASGSPPALASTCPWQDGPYASRIRASLAHWDPKTSYDTDLTTTLDPQPETTP
jgi:hypothetical protein